MRTINYILTFCIVLFLSACNLNSTDVERATFIRVVDGDTIVVDRGMGRETVRLIGINAPESVHNNPDYNTEDGRKSSAYLTQRMAEIDIVYLEKDVNDTDKYGRLLRYVWIIEPKEFDEKEIREGMLNAIILLEGYAQGMTYQPDVNYQDYFTEFTQEARENNKGLWE
ncbi:MAG: thermonuclease family protein [Erysipelotrichaceae bacterium]|nr:thermonuclease family protein [Erysipelotrichaceae bacterium]